MHVRLLFYLHFQQYDIHGLAIHPQKDLLLTADNRGRIDQWYLFAQNQTSADVLKDMNRGNEQGIQIDTLEERKRSRIETKELPHPVYNL